ncbi:hypothetical protein NQ314_015242 [Rhamnusium bicolor]|uniref:Frizzled/Smoothened 7TM domain-containing protein n=1 Tax=Rhamnusium bicolor TaxID=1586634 RepID=A0AAV8X037_9CUCU|nr:hypothetical protein NQ314_015242 [Rhamnusium bicolor]
MFNLGSSLVYYLFNFYSICLNNIYNSTKRFRWPARPILYLTSCGFVTCTIYLIRWIEGPYKTCTGNNSIKY